MTASFSVNIAYLRDISPALASAIDVRKANINVSTSSLPNDFAVRINGELLSEAIISEVNQAISIQVREPSRILIAPLTGEAAPPKASHSILGEAIGSDTNVISPHVLSSKSPLEHINLEKPIRPNTLVCAGALLLLGLDQLLENINACDYIFAEANYDYLCATLHLISLSDLVSKLRQRGCGFSFILQDDPKDFNISIQNYFLKENLLGSPAIQIIKSLDPSPVLLEFISWLQSPYGLKESLYGLLGNETDEINQLLHSLVNVNSRTHDILLLDAKSKASAHDDKTVVLVASGPSLDQAITALKRNSHESIIAAGSSLGTLLRNNIHVSHVVFLEMSSSVYYDLLTLQEEGYDLSTIICFASLTVDPRIPVLFNKVIFFQRPMSSTAAFFNNLSQASLLQAGPQVANATLEIILSQGYKNILLIGYDFSAQDPSYTRSALAIGTSHRNLDIPVRCNQGFTVYSDASLIQCAEFASEAISFYSDINLSIFGPSIIKTNPAANIVSQEDLLTLLSNTAELLQISELNSLHYTHDLTEQECKKLGQFISDDLLTINHIISESSNWSHQLSRKLSVFIQEDPLLDPMHQAGRRILRFPLYHCLSLLALSTIQTTSLDNYNVFKEAAQDTVITLTKISEHLADLLTFTLARITPSGWDEGRLRHHLSCRE